MTRKNATGGAIALLLCGAAMVLPTAAMAQDDGIVRHQKPVTTREVCTETPVYELVATGGPTSYRTTSGTAPGGYDPAGQPATCGSVTSAQPLTCVDSRGTIAADPASCSPAAKASYESKYGKTVHSQPSMPYYTTSTDSLGGAAVVTAIRFTAASYGECIQIAEAEAYSGSTNVALASMGASASAPNVWDPSASYPSRAIDGVRPAGYPQIYHSSCSGGDSLTITLARPTRINRLVVYGRTDYGQGRDNFNYQMLNGSTVVGSGNIDARSGMGEVRLKGSCDPVNPVWKRTKADTGSFCGTQTVQDQLQCVDRDTGSELDSADCGAPPANAPYQVTSREGCGYEWSASAWPAVAPACGEVSQSRTVTCQGSDGQPGTAADCANALMPPYQAPYGTYYNSNYPWPDAPGGSLRLYRMPAACDAGSPEDVRKECDARFMSKNGVNDAYLQPKSSRTVTDRRACEDPAETPATYRWNDPVYTPGPAACGRNTRTADVYCVDDGGTRVADSFCSAATRPASSQEFDDTSACTKDNVTQEEVTPVVIKMGWCGYTSSGGGRHACGNGGITNWRSAGPKSKIAEWRAMGAAMPDELCTGTLIAGQIDSDLIDGTRQTPRAGKNWSVEPVTEKVAGARCVIQWKMGYNDDGSHTVWQAAYYNGAPTGRTGGHYIGKKP